MTGVALALWLIGAVGVAKLWLRRRRGADPADDVWTMVVVASAWPILVGAGVVLVVLVGLADWGDPRPRS